MAFTDPIYVVWFLIEEHLSDIHTSHVPLVCVPCEPYASTVLKFPGQPGETRFKPGRDENSSGSPITFNTKLTEPKGK